MRAQTTIDMPICLNSGAGFTCAMVLIGLLMGIVALWSFSFWGGDIISLSSLT
jgi:hypothetical protein